jgi:hypothetical protein
MKAQKHIAIIAKAQLWMYRELLKNSKGNKTTKNSSKILWKVRC